MSLGQTTESIAHFAGLFHLAIEELRLREAYLEFKSDPRTPVEDEPFQFSPVKFDAPYRLGDFDPRLKVRTDGEPPASGSTNPAPLVPPPAAGNPAVSVPELARVPGTPVDDASGGSLIAPPDYGPGELPGPGPGQTIYIPFVPLPPSVVTVTLQSADLNDNDTLGDIASAGFVVPVFLTAQLKALIDIAEALQPWVPQDLVEAVQSGAAATVAYIQALQDAPVVDATLQTFLTGDDAVKVVVNGEVVQDIPDLTEMLPEFIANKRGEAEQDDTDAGLVPANDADGTGDLFDTQTGYHETFANSAHNVVAGANETHNLAAIKTSWIDAPVIAVAGDVVELNAISQLNVLSDLDDVDGLAKANDAYQSQTVNAARIDTGTPVEDFFAPPVAGGSLGAGLFGAPSVPIAWNIERIEGDVVVSNIVEQHSFVTDHDRLDLTFTANSTMIVTGENQVANSLSVQEFASGYDLIAIGGSMITTNMIEQTNVLLDDDSFVGGGLGAASISSNDNLLVNVAEITKQAHDKQAEMTAELNEALADLAKGVDDLSAEVIKSDLFEGNETLRALYIEGDLIQMNVVDQVNYLGDADQIQMKVDSMMSVVDDMPVAITAGSNLLTNTASIEQLGTDSVVMANGSHYSDALLVQAELIDTDANPLGVSISELASEAVAFLADDLIAEATAVFDEPGFAELGGHSGGTTLDVMETMTV